MSESREDIEKIYLIKKFIDWKDTDFPVNDWDNNKEKILMQAMFRLIDKGWMFDFLTMDIDVGNLKKDVFCHFPYNNDKTQALTQAILYCIDKES